MEKTTQKPTFKEKVGVTTIELDEGLVFNSKRVGPMNFNGLRNADYGQDFRMPTMPELVPLVYASLENKNYETAQNVIKTLKNHWITGNTGILYVPEGMFVQDNPNIRNGKISMNKKTLKNKLGSYEEKGVVFSEDKNVRFVPYGFKKESQTPLELSQNTGISALVNGQENAEKIAKASEHYKLKSYFWTLKNIDSPQARVADLDSYGFGNRLDVIAYDSEYCGNRFSFGVLDKSRSDAPKNK